MPPRAGSHVAQEKRDEAVEAVKRAIDLWPGRPPNWVLHQSLSGYRVVTTVRREADADGNHFAFVSFSDHTYEKIPVDPDKRSQS